jgi:hypothetical protein
MDEKKIKSGIVELFRQTLSSMSLEELKGVKEDIEKQISIKSYKDIKRKTADFLKGYLLQKFPQFENSLHLLECTVLTIFKMEFRYYPDNENDEHYPEANSEYIKIIMEYPDGKELGCIKFMDEYDRLFLEYDIDAGDTFIDINEERMHFKIFNEFWDNYRIISNSLIGIRTRK